MTEIALSSPTPNYRDWLLYGQQRFGVLDATYETPETVQQAQEERTHEWYASMLEYVYETIAHREDGITRGKLVAVLRRLDRDRRDTLIEDLLTAKRIRKTMYKMPRGPSGIKYYAVTKAVS